MTEEGWTGVYATWILLQSRHNEQTNRSRHGKSSRARLHLLPVHRLVHNVPPSLNVLILETTPFPFRSFTLFSYHLERSLVQIDPPIFHLECEIDGVLLYYSFKLTAAYTLYVCNSLPHVRNPI